MPGLILLWLVLAALLVLLLPIFFAELMTASLIKLHLEPGTAVLLVIAVVVGGFINVPIRRIRRAAPMPSHPLAAFGLLEAWPELQRLRPDTIVAVNLGGCVIPVGLACYETILVGRDARILGAVAVAAAVNIIACYLLARPMPRVGIALPALAPALLAALAALLLAPDQAPPVAFVAGVAGPLIGADLLHLAKIGRMEVGIMSIGGAGTFDGIVLSGIIAAYLA